MAPKPRLFRVDQKPPSQGAVRIVRAIEELAPPYPAGLGRPAAELDPDVADLVADPARLRRTLLSCAVAAQFETQALRS